MQLYPRAKGRAVFGDAEDVIYSSLHRNTVSAPVEVS